MASGCVSKNARVVRLGRGAAIWRTCRSVNTSCPAQPAGGRGRYLQGCGVVWPANARPDAIKWKRIWFGLEMALEGGVKPEIVCRKGGWC